MIHVTPLGFPRIGPRRELKFALEEHWAGRSPGTSLMQLASRLRADNWLMQRSLGATQIPVNDFSLYDHVLDTTAMVGAIPRSYGWRGGGVDLDTYFAMARGTRNRQACCDSESVDCDTRDLPALEMTKWFDTNYHYVVPELEHAQTFELATTKPIDEFLQAKALGIPARPVLLGPVTYLLLSKIANAASPLSLLPGLLPVYSEILRRLADAGAQWVQIDEPALMLDLEPAARLAFRTAYETLAVADPRLKLMLTPFFGKLGPNLDTALQLPVAGLHIDMTRSSEEILEIATRRRSDLSISLGVVDGRNVWRADLSRLLDRIEPLVDEIGSEHAMLATSCSLLHVPLDLDAEPDIDSDVKPWLAFAHQKIEELALLARALDRGRVAIQPQLDACDAAIASRHLSGRTSSPSVRKRVAEISPPMEQRRSPYARRRAQQRTALSLPAFPTTTIGSFPQTQSVRQARAAHAKGVIADDAYDEYLRQEIRNAILWQEELDLDVFVHGEFERNDMVQYFAEQLDGYAITKNAWVQSYGSRCVRPPVIYGDVARPRPMTVAWSTFAQSLTSRIMKGMLTGPVTMLKWSFVRDDLPAADVCRQIAFAIRDEVLDLEAAGIRVIQIDEPALREGLPLRRGEWPAYLAWAVQSFRLAASGVDDATQIHTHMCYAEFNDIIEAIGAMDADVISIETARSKMELLNAFATYRYPNEIGPGVYDIHAPRCPSIDEMLALAERANAGLSPEQIWINPDCGLKTRTWEEVRPALANMVSAAKRLRARQL